MRSIKGWCIFFGALLAVCVMAGLPAIAETQSPPPSAHSAPGRWHIMHPSSFPATPESARNQCVDQADANLSDALTREKCELFRQMLVDGRCQTVMVLNGTDYAFMSQRTSASARPVLLINVRKNIMGREAHQATRCDLGRGVQLDFFVGEPGVSCGNVGTRFLPVEEQLRTRLVPMQESTIPIGPSIYYQGLSLCNCVRIPSLFLEGAPGPTTNGGFWLQAE